MSDSCFLFASSPKAKCSSKNLWHGADLVHNKHKLFKASWPLSPSWLCFFSLTCLLLTKFPQGYNKSFHSWNPTPSSPLRADGWSHVWGLLSRLFSPLVTVLLLLLWCLNIFIHEILLPSLRNRVIPFTSKRYSSTQPQDSLGILLPLYCFFLLYHACSLPYIYVQIATGLKKLYLPFILLTYKISSALPFTFKKMVSTIRTPIFL